MEPNYLQIMIESLEKKKKVLQQMIELNNQQKFLLQDANLQPEDFEKNMQYKEELVQQLNLLDEGFENVFARVREALYENKEMYVDEIRQMQEQIKEISTLMNTVSTQETRNKKSATNKFDDVRKQIRSVRNSQRVVKQYYDNMMNHKSDRMQMIDNRK